MYCKFCRKELQGEQGKCPHCGKENGSTGRALPLKGIVRIFMLAALVCFFCSFTKVVCGSAEIVTTNGMEMIAAAYAEEAEAFDIKVIPDVGLIVTFVAGIIGLGCAFIKDVEISSVFSCGASVIAVIFMLCSRYNIEKQVEAYKNVIEMKFMWGWFLVLMLYIVTAVCAYWRLRLEKQS